MVLDLTGTDDVAVGPINCGAPQAISAARVAYKLLVNPDRPVDGGLSARSRSRSGPGLCWRPRSGAVRVVLYPVGAADRPGRQGLGPALPERVAAASYGDSMVIGIEGKDPRNGGRFMVYEPTVGGWGAWRGGDGRARSSTTSTVA